MARNRFDWLTLVTGFLLGIFLVGAAGWLWLLKNDLPTGTDTGPSGGQVAQGAMPVTDQLGSATSLEELRQLITTLAPGVRQQLLDDNVRFAAFVRQRSDRHALLAGARANKLHENQAVQTLMRQGADNVLVDTYLRQLIQANLPSDFPSENHFRKYYEKNPEMFRVPERVQLWQIFLPSEAANAGEVAKQAAAIRAEISSGKISFTDAAGKYSKHVPSNRNGGNMGMLGVDELLPEVKQAVLALDEDVISQPITTSSGVHIIKRGARVPAQSISYEDAKPYIGQRLRGAGQQQVLEAVMVKLRETYPAELGDDEIESWRLQLKKEYGADGAG
jgi:peptidylprolyl isomerase